MTVRRPAPTIAAKSQPASKKSAPAKQPAIKAGPDKSLSAKTSAPGAERSAKGSSAVPQPAAVAKAAAGPAPTVATAPAVKPKPQSNGVALQPMIGGALRKRALVTRPAADTPPPPPSPSVADFDLEAQIGYRIRRAHQRATDIFTQVMAKFDVTPTQFAALAKLHDLGLVSQNHLGRLTGMDPSTILGVVGRLIRQGHVRARPDPADGRLTLLELTPNGRVQVEAMKMAAPMVAQKTLEPISAKDQKVLLELLEKLA